VIDVQDLTITRSGTVIIEGYGFAVERGAILAILGSNGVGKTSLINVIAGLLAPSLGHVTCAGRIGYVPQLFDAAFDYSVTDIVLMGRARHIGLFGAPRNTDFRAAQDCMDRLGVAHLAERSFNTLSGGQRQLVIIAQALASECDVLILDEPCSALDYRNQALVIDVLDRLRAEHGMTILFSTHSPQHALEIATHVLLMHGRDAYDFGPVASTLTEANLSRLYGIAVRQAHFAKAGAYTFAPMYRDQDAGAPRHQ
jgi:iron complex transport system ATP-binding protein